MFTRLLIILLFIYSCNAKAQSGTYNFSRFDIENGLSNNQVNSICRDSIGFTWFGTSAGLNRFDGYNCKVFVNIPGDTSSLEDNYVDRIFRLPDQKLWVASFENVCIYDPVTEKFERNYQRWLSTHALPASKASFILKDSHDNYWFLFEREGLYRFSPAQNKTVRVDLPLPGWSAGPVTTIGETIAGNICMIYANGYLRQINSENFSIISQTHALPAAHAGRGYDYRIFCDRYNQLWAWVNGDSQGLFNIDLSSNAVTHFSTANPRYRLNDNMVTGVMQDQAGTIWVGTDHGGMNLVNGSDHRQISYVLSKEGDRTTLSYNSIQSVFEDGHGQLWIGTGKKGVNFINQHITRFQLFRKSDEAGGLPFEDINYFVEDKKGNVWIGTNGGGLLYFDVKQGSFKSYKNDPSNSNSICHNIIVSLCLDHEDKLWIGTYQGGMDVFDGHVFKHFRNDPMDPGSISDNRVWDILEDSNHVIWAGTLKGGLNRFDRSTGKFAHYFSDNGIARPIHSNYVPVIRRDHLNNLWVGTADGVEVLNSNQSAFTHYTHTADAGSLSHPVVLDIAEDKRQLVWVGTRNGLNAFNRKTGRFTQFSTADGLPDNVISNIVEDTRGDLWITTPKGPCRLVVTMKGNDISFTVRNFNETNNLQGKIFNESATLRLTNGKLLLGGANGFNVVDPAKIPVLDTRPNLVFTNIEIFNNVDNTLERSGPHSALRKTLPYHDRISMSYNENIFTLEFAALEFSNVNQYAYKLEGFNRNWMYTNGANRKVTYTNLDPGTYQFRVKATNSDGNWGDEKTLTVIIAPPIWRTPLAFVFYAMLLAAILYVARRITVERTRMRFEVLQQKNEAERIKALDGVKTKFFTNVSHEFRTPLSLILTPLDKIIRNSPDPEQKKQVQLVQRNARRLLNLVNQLLDFRKMEVQEFRLQLTSGDIIHFTREVTASFSDLAEMKNIRLVFSAEIDHLITYFDKDKLEKILFNLLSNAFKYTPHNGLISVSVCCSEAMVGTEIVSIAVQDTGIGIPVSNQEQIFERFFQHDVAANITNPGTGIGLAIAKEFVKLHKGSISVLSEPGKGARFTVRLPAQSAVMQVVHTGGITELISPPVPAPAIQTPTLQRPASSQPVILLVEDNDDFRFYLKDNLQQNYQVYDAANGMEAWEQLKLVQPALVISDVMMPHMDGIELTRRMKAAGPTKNVPVILLTAIEDEELEMESYELGVHDYMTKPFSFEILESKIKNILSHKTPAPKRNARLIEASPSEIEVPKADEHFVQQVLTAIEKNISNADFTVEELSRDLCMHRAGMYRKLLALTGKTPIEFIRSIRLKRGAQLIEKSHLNISEIAYEVGFNNPKRFSQQFKEEFGMTPSQFQKKDLKSS